MINQKGLVVENKLRLGVNIDHVATIRNARGSSYPDPVDAAMVAYNAGADGITAHLREDRRHIVEADIGNIAKKVDLPLNFEMAATVEMQEIALRYQPNAVCLVPENRLELTTEGGLDVIKNNNFLRDYIAPLKDAGCKVSIFLAANKEQIDAALNVGATTVELHTGSYCEFHCNNNIQGKSIEFEKLKALSRYAFSKGLEVHAGHGLTLETVAQISSIKEIKELNIGHSIISDSIFVGLELAIKNILKQMDEGRSNVQ